ncbi:EAL domain-containing protein [Nitratidesulfovibrio sp. SRB-5]|uniref:sensor domain-containing protein n=1 Tax=Nitratidesulfovibrio sp. SRB-5 TaxID=2872636 RepID=UPI001CBA6005|nr:EAL domain-containing protein [Nitratidesulfovibrio sp. SRB-5]
MPQHMRDEEQEHRAAGGPANAENPGQNASGQGAPGQGAPGHDTPGQGTSGQGTSGSLTSGSQTPGLLRALLDNPLVALFLRDGEGRYLAANHLYADLAGVPGKDVVGLSPRDIFPHAVASALLDEDRRVAEDGTPLLCERMLPDDEAERVFRVAKLPLPTEVAGPGAVLGLAFDVTTLVEAEIEEEVRQRTAALAESTARFRALFELAPDAVYVRGEGGRIVDCNRAAERMSGHPRETLLSLRTADLLPPDIETRIDNLLAGCPLPAATPPDSTPAEPRQGTGGASPGSDFCPTGGFCMEGICTAAHGPHEAEVSVEPLPLSLLRGKGMTALVVVHDISGRRTAERQARLFERVFRNALEGICITDPEGNIVAVNPAFTTITGYPADDAVGQSPRILKSHHHDSAFYEDMWRALVEEGRWEDEIWNRRRNGEVYPEWLSISAIPGPTGRTEYYVAVFHDITELKAKESQIQHQAHHDALTGLPNRALLRDRLGMAINGARREDRKVAVLSVDLDNFKQVNDSLGHMVGDIYLQQAAEQMRQMVRPQDTLARVGGDEFVVVLQDVESERDAAQVAERLLARFTEPVRVQEHELFVGASVGIALFPDDGDDPDTLVRNADIAMSRAKEQGKRRYHLFTPAMNDRAVRRLSLEGDLHRALAAGDITAHYQPRVDLNTGLITGMEALARWTRADGSQEHPAEFIPLAESTGLIVPLGEHMLRLACAKTRALCDAGHADLHVAVNLSVHQFRHRNLVGMVADVLAETGLPPHLLELEITESTIVTDVDHTIRKLNQLAEMGIALSVDDFGTGYSSLYQLKNLPLTSLKIDRSFISDIPDDPNDAAIAATIITMADRLGLRVVAEGVETPEQLNFLLLEGCHEVQGFLFSRPLPPDEFTALLARGRLLTVPRDGDGDT